MPEKIAVRGMSCLSAAGLNLEENLQSIYGGQRQPKISKKIITDHPLALPVFEISHDFKKDEEPGLSDCTLYALAAATQAIKDAGLDPEELKKLSVGVAVGTTVDSPLKLETFYRGHKEKSEPDFSILEASNRSNPALSIQRKWGLNGPCLTVVNACTSGADAIGLAASWLRAGLCDLVIAGGSDHLGRVTYNGFRSLQIMNDEPCTPFDKDRKGLNLGEGAAMMILQRENQSPRARAFLLGYGSGTDAFHLTAPAPDGRGLKRAVAEALRFAGSEAKEISFVNVHGTGTQENDKVEGQFLNEHFSGLPFVSTKGYTGHTLGAAGAIEAVLTVAGLEKKKIPASAGFLNFDPLCAAAPVTEVTEVRGHKALSQSLAFGGCNAALVFSDAD
jgi:3-oxoacyl-[acyl-carrier-protein] synthase II